MENKAPCDLDLTNAKNKYTFEITTTQLCNMRCTYCFENIGGHLDDPRNLNDYIPNIIEKAKLMLEYPSFKEQYNGIHFSFWGGESSMNMKMIKDIVNEFYKNKDCSFFMYSNGLEVDALLKYLLKLKEDAPDIVDRYRIQFSYDGQPVHDMTRLDIKGISTGKRILENVMKFNEAGFKVSIKSTIRHDDFKFMADAWKDIDSLDKTLKEKYDYNITYSPTIDEDHHLDDKYFEEFKNSVIEIAKLEFERRQKGLPHLMSWFGGRKGQCSVGATMGCLSVDGNYYLCHAANYASAEDKKSFSISNIRASNDQFLDDILIKSKEIFGIKENFTEDINCQNCSATNCPRCEVINYAKSKKETFDERWTEYNVDYIGFCRYWKFFGLVDRALQQKLSKHYVKNS